VFAKRAGSLSHPQAQSFEGRFGFFPDRFSYPEARITNVQGAGISKRDRETTRIDIAANREIAEESTSRICRVPSPGAELALRSEATNGRHPLPALRGEGPCHRRYSDFMSYGLVAGFLLDRQWHWLRGEMEQTEKPALLALCRVFFEQNTQYAIIGGLALQVHHPDPRTTLDIDIAVLTRAAIPREALEAAGFHFRQTFEHSENWEASDGTATALPSSSATTLRCRKR